jgi:signal transduction histidine kinase
MSSGTDIGIFQTTTPMSLGFWRWLPRGSPLPNDVWRIRHRLMVAIALAHLPLLGLVASSAGVEGWHVAGELGMIAVLVASSTIFEHRTVKAVVVSLALLTCSGLLVHFTGGLIESHFHFFVVVPLVSLYRDWRPLGTGLIFVMVHHSVVGVLSPEDIFNHPSALAHPVRWAFIHAGYILMLTGVILTYWRFAENLERTVARQEELKRIAEDEYHRSETERLELLVRSKDKFVASVSHELRTPLAAVLGFAQVLSDDTGGLSTADRIELTATIVREAHDLAGIVEDLLVSARADMDSVYVSEVLVDLRAAAAQVVDVLPEADKTHVSISDEPRRIRALADPVRVRQVIRNLVSNALRYGGDDIRVDFQVVEPHAIVSVSDNGPGIPESEREQIFLPYQVAHSPGSQPSSVGLGLTVSRQLVQLMGGSLTYRHEGGSSVFEIRLPSARDPDEDGGAHVNQRTDRHPISV